MSYITQFEITALVFLIIVALHFFGKYKFPSTQNHIFSLLVFAGVCDVCLDLISSFTIEHCQAIPGWINMVLNMVFYFFQNSIVPLFYCYVLSVTGFFKKKYKKYIIITLLPYFFFVTVLMLNPIIKNIFYMDGSMYVRGKHFETVFYGSAFYVLLIAVFINIYRKKIRDVEYKTFTGCLLLIVISVLLQYRYPMYLLTGVALSLSVFMVYLTLQNPDDLLDDLTGLFNRSCFMDYMANELENQEPYNLVLLGLDETKLINNMFGITNGNEVIRQVAAFSKSLTASKMAFRLIGDQFAIVCRDAEECKEVIKKIQTRFKVPWQIHEMEMNLSTCICYFMDAKSRCTLSELIMMLEYMMVEAKKEGKGTVFEIDDAARRSMQREIEVETGLRDAIDKNALEVHFQPIYSVKKKSFIAAEALVRFTHETYGFISPAEFIPLAEKKGLIAKIGEQVFEKVCQVIRDFRLEHAYQLECIEVNLSAMEVMNEHLAEALIKTLKKYHVTPSFINFEITETAATTAHETTKRNMNIMTAEGIRFAMDDYGTGYANVDSVIRLPFSTVKIDRSMLMASFDHERSAVMLYKTIELMQALNLDIVVEGAETEEQAAVLLERGVDFIQGFYYARPMQIDKFTAFLEMTS